MTPEGRIKNKIREILDIYKGRLYVHMPVSHGYGAATLDYYGAIKGQAFAIEAKKPGGKPTLRQQGAISSMRAAGITVFLVATDDDLLELSSWLKEVDSL
jgi:hypothetical protein